MKSFAEMKQELLRKVEAQVETEKLKLKEVVAKEIKDARRAGGFSQKDLSEMVNTQQSSISRLEDSTELPSLSFLVKVATYLGKKVEIKFVDVE